MYKTDSRKEAKGEANAITFHSQSLRSDKYKWGAIENSPILLS